MSISSLLLVPSTTHYVQVEAEVRELTIEEKILQELPPVFIEIAKAESGLKPTAHNPEYHKSGKCYGSFGLFQVGCLHYEGNPEDLFDEDLNIEYAKKVYEKQGLRAWSVCTNGRVNCGI